MREEYQITPETVTSANATERLERRMSDLVDLFAIFIEEGKQIDPRAWEHLLIYAPKAASPLPEEIAGLLALNEDLPDGPWEARGRLSGWWVVWDRYECAVAPNLTEGVARAIAALPSLFAALQQMARENERLKGELSYMTDEVTPANLACIRELEAERGRLKSDIAANEIDCDTLARHNSELEAERDAVRKANLALAGLATDRLAERNKLRETLSAMNCPRQLNAGTIAECTGRLECGCHAGAVFVKAGTAQE